MQLRKILAAGSLAALMAGSSIAFAATLADYPQPFIKSDGTADFLVVVGASADPADVVGAIDTATRLGGEATTEYTCTGASAGVTVTGEGKEIATTNTKIYLNDALRKTGARVTFTSSELPTTLASGTLIDSDASDSYKYDQYIDLTSQYFVTFDQHTPSSGVTEDPALVINQGGQASNSATPTVDNALYKVRVVFQKNVNSTTAVGETVKLFGNSYTIASTTDMGASSPKLVLFGSSDTRVFTAKEPVSVTIGGTEYTVTLGGVTGSTTGVVTVGSETKSVTKGNTYTVGGLNVYVEDVYYYSTTDQSVNQAKLGLGAEQLTFEQGKRVTRGSSGSETNIDGTTANLTAVTMSSGGKGLSSLEVYVVPSKTNMDALKKGEEFMDPIFKSFKLKYATATPDLTDSARNLLDVKNSGNDMLTFTWTDFKGYQKTITWAYPATAMKLQDSSNYAIHVTEGEKIFQNEYLVVDSGDFTHFLRVTTLNNDGTTDSSTDAIEFTDQFSGSTYKFTLGMTNRTIAYIDGQAYYVDGGQPGYTNFVIITWGDGATYNNVGSLATVFPKLKGKGGEYLAMANQSDVSLVTTRNGTIGTATNISYIELPTGKLAVAIEDRGGYYHLNLTAYTGYSISTSNLTYFNLSSGTDNKVIYLGKTTTGGFYYNISGVNNRTIRVTPLGRTAAKKSAPEDAYQSDENLILVEEQEKDGNVYSVRIPAINSSSGGTTRIGVGTPDFTYNNETATSGQALKSNTYMTQYVDLYGVFAEKYSYGVDNTLKVYYPDEQMTNEIFVLAKDATVTTTAAVAGATVKQASPIKTAVAKLDSEIGDTEKSTKNIILVGGPCANTLVRTLLNATLDTCVEDFEADGYTAGSAMIKLVSDAWGTGKAALIVAGYNKEDTRKACTVLQKYDEYEDKLTGAEVKVVDTTITAVA